MVDIKIKNSNRPFIQLHLFINQPAVIFSDFPRIYYRIKWNAPHSRRPAHHAVVNTSIDRPVIHTFNTEPGGYHVFRSQAKRTSTYTQSKAISSNRNNSLFLFPPSFFHTINQYITLSL